MVLVAACDGGEHSVAGSGAEAADQPAVAQEDGGNQEGGETGPDGGDGAAGGVASSESGSAGDGTASSLGRTPAPGASDSGLEPLERKGNLAITATNPRVFSRIAGACDANDSQVQFLSDDGLTRFVVFTGGVVGAAGEITADVEGANVTWVAAAESETSAA